MIRINLTGDFASDRMLVTECKQLCFEIPGFGPRKIAADFGGGKVAVPTPEQERQRSVVRYREQLLRDRRRTEARGRALLH